MTKDPTVSERVRRYNKKHPAKRKARSKVYIKVRRGDLPKLPAGHDYHHTDYSSGKVVPRTHKSHTQQRKRKK